MGKNVLSIGNCSFDDRNLSRFFMQNFEASLDSAADFDEAKHKLVHGEYSLVLVNRHLDKDYSEGMDVIKSLKADPKLKSFPVMLLSNHEEYQKEACADGAIPGFGKAQLTDPQMIDRVRQAIE